VTYAEYDRFLQRFHMIKLSAPTFKRILNASTNEAIVEAAKMAGSSSPVGFILAQTGEYTFANAIDYLRTMGAHASLFDYSETTGNPVNTITLTHDLGQNGTIFLAHCVDSILKPLGNDFKILEFPDAITIKF
jgi:hypothetical protein